MILVVFQQQGCHGGVAASRPSLRAELDVIACPRCGSRTAVLAVIVEAAQIRKIIASMERHGRGPPPPE
jgi:hypothetical protein